MTDFHWAAVFLTGASMAGAVAWLILWAIGAERRIKALEDRRLSLRQLLVRVLSKHPEARAAVVATLEDEAGV